MTDPSLISSIRSSCRKVVDGACAVRIVESSIPSLVDSLPDPWPSTLEMDSSCHLLGRGEETLAFLLTLAAVNFGSGYFPRLSRLSGRSGYFTIASALKDRFESKGPFSAGELAHLTAGDCAVLFRQEAEDPMIYQLMALFAQSLRDLGGYLESGFAGRFDRLVASADHSAPALASLLAEMPLFQDVAWWQGEKIPFFKRAQLAVADLYIAFGGMGWGQFYDLDRLTIMADNLVPHVLRCEGILRYDASLGSRIDRGELLPAGSPEEIEIRASAVQACEMILAALHRRGRQVNAVMLDNHLWHRGQLARFRRIPRHRTLTVNY